MQTSKTLENKKITLSTEIDAVRLLLQNEEFAAKYSENLHPSLFRESLRPIVEISTKYWQQYRNLCPNQVLVQELAYKVGTGFTKEKQDAVLNILIQVKGEVQAPSYTEEQISGFIRFQRMENAIAQSMIIVDEADKTRDDSKLDQIPHLINKASERLDIKKPSFLLGDLETRTDYRTKLSSGELKFEGFGTGIPQLDNWRLPARGLLRGELGVVIAATGRGKSIALTHFAETAFLHGHKVVYISLELPEDMLLNRADAMLTQATISNIIEERHFIRDRILEMQESMNFGEILFKELPCTGVNVYKLKNELKQYQQIYNFEPDVICVDFMDLMIPTSKSKEGSWKDQMTIGQDLRNMGGEFNAAVWTASQGNRGSATKNEEGENLTDADVAESYAKLGVVDWAITLNRTKTQNSMPEPRPLTLYTVKNRTGVANKAHSILTDFSKMQFFVGDAPKPADDAEANQHNILNSTAFVQKV